MHPVCARTQLTSGHVISAPTSQLSLTLRHFQDLVDRHQSADCSSVRGNLRIDQPTIRPVRPMTPLRNPRPPFCHCDPHPLDSIRMVPRTGPLKMKTSKRLWLAAALPRRAFGTGRLLLRPGVRTFPCPGDEADDDTCKLKRDHLPEATFLLIN